VISASQNSKNTQNAIDNWMLGPLVPNNMPTANKDYWREIAAALLISEKEARCQLCSNCEYYDNTPETKSEMLAIPMNKYDVGAGSRGFCAKLDFICHDLRVCIAWERKDFEDPDEKEMD
jgi:hypothetical protein